MRNKVEAGSLLYRSYYNMRTRCNNENGTGYKYWGGKGIKVCDEWLENRQAFFDWAIENGYGPRLQLDRIDNNGDYSSDNCRWVTSSEQNRNRSDNTTDWEKRTRICYICKQTKSLDSFWGNGQNTYMCNVCAREYHREYQRKYLRKKRSSTKH